MEREKRVARMRQLLKDAVHASSDAVLSGFVRPKPGDGIVISMRRRAMVKNVELAARQYDLRPEIEAFLAEADCVSVAGLDDQRLFALSKWLGEVMSRYDVAADPLEAPAAR